jgi:two-component system LytT family response regulator
MRKPKNSHRMKQIRTLVIDDERPARAEVIRQLAAFPEILILGEAATADQASAMIELLKPELIFLDINMPGRSGIEMLESLRYLPKVIFLTAYDEFAVKAFELSAIDYLLKPLRKERLQMAIEKVKHSIDMHQERTVFVKDKSGFKFIKWSKVCLVSSEGNYARIHLNGESYQIKRSLNQLDESEDCERFFRANRSELINLDHIQTIKEQDQALSVLLSCGTTVTLSQRQAVKLRTRIKL